MVENVFQELNFQAKHDLLTIGMCVWIRMNGFVSILLHENVLRKSKLKWLLFFIEFITIYGYLMEMSSWCKSYLFMS